MSVARFGVSLEQELLKALDKYVDDNHFANRSQAIRQLINNNLVEKKWQCNNIVAGSVTLVFDHNKRDIFNNLDDILQEYKSVVLSTQRFYLDQSYSLEIVAVKGIAATLTELADKLKAVKGIQHGKLSMSRAD
jgi:CopG family transcriptional regulator, nickel-responsive regulator